MGHLKGIVLFVSVLVVLLVVQKGLADFGVPFDEPDKWYLHDEYSDPFTEWCVDSSQQDPVHLVFYNGATKERTVEDLIYHLPEFDTSNSGGDKCIYDSGEWKEQDIEKLTDWVSGERDHIRIREGKDGDDAFFDTYTLGAAHHDITISCLGFDWHVSQKYNQTRDWIYEATNDSAYGHSGWKGWVGNTDPNVQEHVTGFCTYTALGSDGYVAFSELGRLEIKDTTLFGPAPVNLSDSQGRYLWVIVELENPTSVGQEAQVSLEVTGVPTGCNQVQQLVLPGSQTFWMFANEAKWVLYREHYQCHAPASSGYTSLEVKFCIREAHHSFDYDCEERTRLFIVRD